MGIFERYLSVWVGLSIVLGVVLGLWQPDAFQVIANFEIAHVERLAGPDSRVVWVHTTGPGVFSLQADSEGATQAARSYNVGIGGHQHAQLHLIENEGIYDITFVAWDTNGLYLQSEPCSSRGACSLSRRHQRRRSRHPGRLQRLGHGFQQPSARVRSERRRRVLTSGFQCLGG